MQARVFQFQVGRSKIGWVGRILFAVVAVVLIGLLLTFGVVAAVVGVVALAAIKLIRAFGPTPPPAVTSSPEWQESAVVVSETLTEESGPVRDIEVEVIEVESAPGTSPDTSSRA